MKNARFILGLFLGVIISAAIFFVVSCKSEPTISETTGSNPPSSTMIKQLNSGTDVYKLDVDNIQYIVVVNGTDGGVAIIQHKFLTQ